MSNENKNTPNSTVENAKKETDLVSIESSENSVTAERIIDPTILNDNQNDNRNEPVNVYNSAGAVAMNMAANVISNFVSNLNRKDQTINNKSNEMNKKTKDFSLNFSSVTNNPVEMLYNHVTNTLAEIIDDFFIYQFEKYKPIVKTTFKLSSQINDFAESIKEKKRELQYTKKRWLHALFIISFVFLFGFFFWKKYKANLAIINEFKDFKAKQENNILKASNERFVLMSGLFSTTTLFDIYKYCFSRYGIKISELLPVTKILKILNNKNNIDIKSGISGLYKNTPFYDVLARSLVWREVVTSSSASFSYISYTTVTDSNGRSRTVPVTNYETLTAYHKENTPFIESDNVLLFLTRFEPKLIFSNNNEKVNKNIQLEIDGFADKLKLDVVGDVKNDLQIQQKLSQFFTIKAQEDYLSWYKFNSGNIFDFFKVKDSLIVFNQSHEQLLLEANNLMFTDMNFFKNDPKLDLNYMWGEITNLVFRYFDKVFKMLQLPLLSPAINREWYKHNSKNYMIGNNLNDNSFSVDDVANLDNMFTILKFLDPKFLWFNCDRKPTKEIWFKLNGSMQHKNSLVIHSHYNMNSFWSQRLVDMVPVTGVHVGTKIIAVPYERFYFFTEEKFLAHLFFKNINNVKISITPNVRHLICNQMYLNENFANIMIKNNIWTDNPLWVENFQANMRLVEIAKKFNEYNKDGQASLHLDNHGVYFVSNSVHTNNPFVEKILNDMYEIFKS